MGHECTDKAAGALAVVGSSVSSQSKMRIVPVLAERPTRKSGAISFKADAEIATSLPACSHHACSRVLLRFVHEAMGNQRTGPRGRLVEFWHRAALLRLHPGQISPQQKLKLMAFQDALGNLLRA